MCDKVKEKFDKFSDDFLKFDNIENKFSNIREIHGMILLSKLFPNMESLFSGVDKEQVFFDLDYNDLSKLTDEQVKELRQCGFSYDKDYCVLFMYV